MIIFRIIFGVAIFLSGINDFVDAMDNAEKSIENLNENFQSIICDGCLKTHGLSPHVRKLYIIS